MADEEKNTDTINLRSGNHGKVSVVDLGRSNTSSVRVVSNNRGEVFDALKESEEFINNFENNFAPGPNTDKLRVETDIENTDFGEETVPGNGEPYPFDNAAAVRMAVGNVSMAQKNFTIVAVGGELVSGYGDPRALGCLGRVVARTFEHPFFRDEHATLRVFPLAMPNETIETLNEHWQQETERRFAALKDDERAQPQDNRLIIFLPNLDALDFGSTTRTRLTFASILDNAIKAGYQPFVVGPVPSLDPNLNSTVAELNNGYADASSRRSVPYVNTFSPLLSHGQWQKDLASNGGVPGQAGHGLIAWLILHRGWFEWLGLEEPMF